MVNIIVGSKSQSGSKEFSEGDIGTSRSKITLSDGSLIESGLRLLDLEKIKEGVLKIVQDPTLQESDSIDITMHAMSMSGMEWDYPNLFVQTLRNSLSKVGDLDSEEVIKEVGENRKKINAILISFHGAASEKNINGSHAYYPVRKIKEFMENSLLTCDADKRKIVDLEIFDSPSSKVLGLTFIGVVGQFIEFMESNKNHSITKEVKKNLKKFLGDDYEKLLNFFGKYPLSGKLINGQFSIKELGEKGELDSVSNRLASQINFAKLSYISGIISDLYLELAMIDLRENKDEILNTPGDRFLLSWDRINNIYNNPQLNSNSENLVKKLNSKLETNRQDVPKITSGVFVMNGASEEGDEIEYAFNPTEENFGIIGNNEVGGHFGVIPLFMIDGLIYNSGLLSEEDSEYIMETKPISMMFTGNEIIVTRKDNTITICNKYNKNEVFSQIQIGIQEKSIAQKDLGLLLEDGGLLLGKKYNKYSKNVVPHGKKWFKTFSKNILEPTPFGLDIDSRAKIIEAIGVKLARNYFANPIEGNVDSLKEAFPKLKDFSKLKGIFGKIKTTQMDPEFERKIEGSEYDIVIKNVRGDNKLLTVNVCVIVGNEIVGNEIISEHSLMLL